MAEKATTDTTPAETVTVPDTAIVGDEGAATPPPTPEPAAAPTKATAGRTSAKRTPKGENKERVEEYISHKPDGNGGYIEVTVRRNIDTGASEIVDG